MKGFREVAAPLVLEAGETKGARGRRRDGGFSLIELALSVTVLILLTLAVMERQLRFQHKARATKAKMEARKELSARALYQFDHLGERPPSTRCLRGRYLSGTSIERR